MRVCENEDCVENAFIAKIRVRRNAFIAKMGSCENACMLWKEVNLLNLIFYK